MKLKLFSLAAVAVLSLGLAACSFVSAADAAPMITSAIQTASPPGMAATALAAAALGVTAAPSSLQVTEDYSAARATAPRVSLDDMKSKIAFTHYFTAGEASRAISGLTVEESNPSLEILTLCLVVMHNGFTVVGKSAPASAENFDTEKGRVFAYEDAIRQLWPLEGYALRDRLASAAPSGEA